MKTVFLSHENAALLNRNVILHYIKKHGTVSRTDIWEAMDISRASVTQVIRQLLDEELLVEAGKVQHSLGRAQKNLALNESARLMYIFDWNTRQLCLVNLNGSILKRVWPAFPANCIPSAFRRISLEGSRQLSEEMPVEPDKLLGLGFCMPGLIDCRSCTIHYSTELNWRDVDIGALFADAFGDHVYLERTGNMIALGEYEYGAARNVKHLLLILLENEGLGASSVVRGDCQHGTNYMFGELGHIKVDSDVICSCGQKGCLEAVILDRLMHNGGVVDEAITRYISLGISAAINLIDPGMVILSGKLVHFMNERERDALEEAIRCRVTNDRSRHTQIVFSGSNNEMGIRGMSAYIFGQHFKI
ncbi:MAG: ROK family transcriptional regulator [Clostridia bacterium]|nr:ROK family transcriptional regulator [Clostridia bacterium]